MKPKKTYHAFWGVDPGLNGGIALVSKDNNVTIFDTPKIKVESKGKIINTIDVYKLATILRQYEAPVIVEQVAALPGQGVVSTFTFGKHYGIILGMIGAINLPYAFVHPRTWKNFYGLDSDKKKSIYLARQKFPIYERLFTKDGTSEAALIGLWGLENAETVIPKLTRCIE